MCLVISRKTVNTVRGFSLSAFFTLVLTLASPTLAEDSVDFADANLKAAVEAKLGILDPTPTDMLGLIELDAQSSEITDLTGLEFATNLSKLILWNNQISNVSALVELTNLTVLILSHNHLSDISALAGMSKLDLLYLDHNLISDISALAGMTKIDNLNLYQNQISDISPLVGMTMLSTLSVSSNQVSDISALAGMSKLDLLYLDHNLISDISALAGMTKLDTLYLDNNQISDISPLLGIMWNLTYLDLMSNPLNIEAYRILRMHDDQNIWIGTIYTFLYDAEGSAYFANGNLKATVEAKLGILDPTPSDMLDLVELYAGGSKIHSLTGLEFATNLRKLDLHDNRISDISALAGMTEMDTLNLSYNQIIDISPLAEMAKNKDISALTGLTRPLSALNLSNNQISDLSPLAEMIYMTTLYLSNNQIHDISPLSEMSYMVWLDLSDNQIIDISPLAEMTMQLYRLDLYRNQISDISALVGSTDLLTLDLHQNQIRDISALAGMTEMRWLILHKNQISDISVLTGMTKLKELLLHQNEIRAIPALAGMTELTKLHLYDNEISDISGLAGITTLEELWLNYNKISDISALKDLTHCKSLVLSDNQISDISALKGTRSNGVRLENNPLNYEAYAIYIPRIVSNRLSNNWWYIDYDPFEMVDDDAPLDPGPYDLSISDPCENGNPNHPFDMIQEGIDAAQEGATVFVLGGRYYENIDLLGKSITVQGVGYDDDDPNLPLDTVIDGNGVGTVITMDDHEDASCVLNNMVITNGNGVHAGGVYCWESSPILNNCLIVGNRVLPPGDSGGAVYAFDSNAVFINCTFSGNYGGENGAGLHFTDSNAVVINSIISDNIPIDVLTSGSDASQFGEYNFLGDFADNYPLFFSPGYWADPAVPNVLLDPSEPRAIWIDGDYHLMSEAGRWDQNSLEWVIDTVTSPSIDAGDPNSPIGDEPEPNGGFINQGAYGGTNQASMSIATGI